MDMQEDGLIQLGNRNASNTRFTSPNPDAAQIYEPGQLMI